MTQVAKIEPEATAPAPINQTVALVQMIERAATNPEADMDKMERLMEMYERMTDRQAKAEFHGALSDMLPRMPIIGKAGAIKNKAGDKQSGYAKWEDVVEAISPILSEFGFGLTFRTRTEEGRIIVTAVLSHRNGHSEQTDSPPMQADTSGSKNNVQALGSTVSYGKRYAAFALLNIAARDEDDDGQAAGAQTITEDQHNALRDLLERAATHQDMLLKVYGINALHELPASLFVAAKGLVEAKIRQRK